MITILWIVIFIFPERLTLINSLNISKVAFIVDFKKFLYSMFSERSYPIENNLQKKRQNDKNLNDEFYYL